MFSFVQKPSTLLRTSLFSSPSLTVQTRQKLTATSIRNAGRGKKVDQALARSTDLFKTYPPITPGIRHVIRPRNDHLWEGAPLRALTIARRKKGGRNNHGRITVRHIGGGHKQRIRSVDFHRREPGVHDVIRIEFDPTRSAHLALLRKRDPSPRDTTVWSYIIAPGSLRAGDQVQSFRNGIPKDMMPSISRSDPALNEPIVIDPEETDGDRALRLRIAEDEAKARENLALGLVRSMTLKPGNVLPLYMIPIGTVIHNISLRPEGPGVLVRSAGSSGMIMTFEENNGYAHVKLQSGEVRKLHRNCHATIGAVSNQLWKNRNLGKAGRSRRLGIRPTVRGVAMNKKDHPHGGGRGKSKSNKHPVSPWGWQTKGLRTRKPGPKGPKGSNKMVVHERPRGEDKKRS
ncbi:translation protein SH3-like domain-containing protein [Flagelloscypha sp. PMI_526]|nr:translation protein SH3-like domain-containing protein [Flagelloscypha sp. PMI_526]